MCAPVDVTVISHSAALGAVYYEPGNPEIMAGHSVVDLEGARHALGEDYLRYMYIYSTRVGSRLPTRSSMLSARTRGSNLQDFTSFKAL